MYKTNIIFKRRDKAAYSRFGYLFITAGAAQLADDPVERRGHALCPTDLVLLSCGIPVELEGPAFRAVREQAAQRQPDLDDIDARVRAARDTASQDMHR